ncbi:MAG: hypothetical protein P8N76_26320 [Pirellulaceae bacterium]|nr:hypothetical protein [Planctomycetaceae bacterium]MDG2385214.1 hypothetical protein [Pirellulaceae bacterium]
MCNKLITTLAKRALLGQFSPVVVCRVITKQARGIVFVKPLLVLSLLVLAGCDNRVANDTVNVQSEVLSPNGKLIATSFNCEGGGAAGYNYSNVSLRKFSDPLNQRNGLLGKHKTWSGFSNIKLRWIDDANLEVSYSQATQPEYRDHNSVRVESKHGVKIHYLIPD